ncbi:protocadherin gamma-A12-like protein [Labeo rohita]|uniref:Protocadherin gamma-A12-like protein n=1 Tax=Labeo rohita TaxID=84645 RepID=A0A498N0F2_LABRO|nr:protocadherin gamma-A12-like protein [Labeo rohita]
MAVARGQVRYSIPEEMKKGSLVGNIVQDLGLDVKRLKSGRARIFTEDSREYIGLNVDKGTLTAPKKSTCDKHFAVLELNPKRRCWLISTYGQVRYSVPEEMAPGSFVGDIVKDLGLELKRLTTGKARIFAAGGREYVALDREKGHIIIKERIDRELLCAGAVSACSLSFEVILENPIELYRITIEILDVNDNSPAFPRVLKRMTQIWEPTHAYHTSFQTMI